MINAAVSELHFKIENWDTSKKRYVSPGAKICLSIPMTSWVTVAKTDDSPNFCKKFIAAEFTDILIDFDEFDGCIWRSEIIVESSS